MQAAVAEAALRTTRDLDGNSSPAPLGVTGLAEAAEREGAREVDREDSQREGVIAAARDGRVDQEAGGCCASRSNPVAGYAQELFGAARRW